MFDITYYAAVVMFSPFHCCLRSSSSSQSSRFELMMGWDALQPAWLMSFKSSLPIRAGDMTLVRPSLNPIKNLISSMLWEKTGAQPFVPVLLYHSILQKVHLTLSAPWAAYMQKNPSMPKATCVHYFTSRFIDGIFLLLTSNKITRIENEEKQLGYSWPIVDIQRFFCKNDNFYIRRKND